jgi:hypothetical protein
VTPMRTKRNLSTLLRHLSYPRWRLHGVFPKRALAAIGKAIAASEERHGGELRFVVEGGLDLRHLCRGTSSRERAIELFSQLRVWDTEANSGVLLYVGLADRRVELVADRGIHGRVGEATWQKICARMESEFRDGNFERGALAGVDEIGKVLAEHFPAAGENPDELANAPVVL